MSRSGRRERLEQLLSLAQTYRGCSRKQLGRELGRDASKLIPQSGMPKLDLVMDLARLMDWSVQQVAGYLCDEEDSIPTDVVDDGPTLNLDFPVKRELEWKQGATSCSGLLRKTRNAARAGRFVHAVNFARQAECVAETDAQRGNALHRQALAWNGLGRFDHVQRVAQRALQLSRLPEETRMLLQADLAGAYYALWHLPEAGAIAQQLVDHFARSKPPAKPSMQCVEASAYFLRGHTMRRQLSFDLDPEDRTDIATQARKDLQIAAARFRALDDPDELCLNSAASSEGMALTCEGGLLEVDVALNRRTANDALEMIQRKLDDLVDLLNQPPSAGIESYGWWCIFGCNLALRHITNERELQKTMAVLTNKADEIGEYLDDWSIRERVFTMQYMQRQRLETWTGVQQPMTMDADDLRIMAGTMGRFSSFRSTAWSMLRNAKIVK